jgi:hydroxymethylbilane synthase
LEGEIRSVVLALETMLPAPGQAALGIETRRDDAKAIAAVSKLEHRATRAAVTAERSLLRALSGGCLAPIAAFGSVDGESLRLIATVIAPDASLKLLVEVEGNADEPKGLGRQAASSLLALGAEAIISAAR